MAVSVSVDDCLRRISDPNVFYLVLLAARAARERGLKPVDALGFVATSGEVPQLEESFARSLLSPVPQAIEVVATSAGPRVSGAEDRFGGGDMDEGALLRAMEGHLASLASAARFPRSRYCAGAQSGCVDSVLGGTEEDRPSPPAPADGPLAGGERQ